MTVQVSVYQGIELAGEGAILAKVDGDDVMIWPQGVGRGGPVITMTREDWLRIRNSVDAILGIGVKRG